MSSVPASSTLGSLIFCIYVLLSRIKPHCKEGSRRAHRRPHSIQHRTWSGSCAVEGMLGERFTDGCVLVGELCRLD